MQCGYRVVLCRHTQGKREAYLCAEFWHAHASDLAHDQSAEGYAIFRLVQCDDTTFQIDILPGQVQQFHFTRASR